jgi:hypothetical protein
MLTCGGYGLAPGSRCWYRLADRSYGTNYATKGNTRTILPHWFGRQRGEADADDVSDEESFRAAAAAKDKAVAVHLGIPKLRCPLAQAKGLGLIADSSLPPSDLVSRPGVQVANSALSPGGI